MSDSKTESRPSLLRHIAQTVAPLSASTAEDMRKVGLDPTSQTDRASYKAMMMQVTPQVAPRTGSQVEKYTLEPAATKYVPPESDST